MVLTRDEVAALLGELTGTSWLAASLLYGSGLRLLECLRLRVQDLDFARSEITVRSGKGRKDRRTMLPQALHEPLRQRMGLIKNAGETARTFYAYMSGPAARVIMRKYGFVLPGESS